MARPHIVRAGKSLIDAHLFQSDPSTNRRPPDTLDLQDHDQPSAQTHVQSPSLTRGAAPHHASELRHVQQERHSESESLADQWGSGRSSHEGSELLEEDPDFLLEGGPDPHDHGHIQSALQQNGTHLATHAGDQTRRTMENGVDDDDDGADEDGDGNEEEDDGVDKISSSPSIEDVQSAPVLDLHGGNDVDLGWNADDHECQDGIDPLWQTERFSDSDSSDTCLHDTEDIDFEFVYALHTFVATVEGQANATKGDTMVLLDDSNSYWWLVRVVKDSSIGYLPAEHIETPTERLARLNKHRNIDLAQSMLGDVPQQSKNPLKKAMRRRNAKMVQFTAPTYFEPPENDWSDEEGDGDDDEGDIALAERQDTGAQDQEHEEPLASEPEASEEPKPSAQVQQAEDRISPVDANQEPQSVEDLDKAGDESAQRKTRNGTIRNTDSFFKDDTVEPRKISLTPNLLRDGSNGIAAADLKDSPTSPTQETVFDTLDRSASTSSKSSKKDKKPGMLSGLFKRKDKKIKVDEASGGIVAKEGATDIPLSPSAMTAGESISDASVSPISPTTGSRKSGPNKLAKPPPASVTAAASAAGTARTLISSSSNSSLRDAQKTPAGPAAESANTTSNGLSPETKQPLNIRIPDGDDDQKSSSRIRSPLTNLVASDQPKKEKLKKAKTRIELDVDSSPESETGPSGPLSNTATAPAGPSPGRPAPSAPLQSTNGKLTNGAPRDDQQQYPSLSTEFQPRMTHSASSGESDGPHTPIMHQSRGTFGDGPEGSSLTNGTSTGSMGTPDASAPMTTAENERFTRDSWDGATLRTYLDANSTNEVKDMLVIINDHTGVVPVSQDHPVMAELGLLEQQRKLDALSVQLDGLLQGFLEKRKATRAQAAAAAASGTGSVAGPAAVAS